MKNLLNYTSIFGLNAFLLFSIVGCAGVQPSQAMSEPVKQADFSASHIAKPAEILPNFRVLNTKAKPKANLANFLKTAKLSMEFEKMTLETVLSVMAQTGDFNAIIDRNIALDKEIATRLIDVTAEEALNTLLSYDCLNYKAIDNNAVYIYKDLENEQCHAQPIAPEPNKALLNSSPVSMDLERMPLATILQLLASSIKTNIAIDNNVSNTRMGVYQIDVKPLTLLNRILEADCLSYRKTGENTLFIYQPKNQKCQFTPLQKAELTKIPELQKTVTFDEKYPIHFPGIPLSIAYYLSSIRYTTQLNILTKDIIGDSKNYGNIQVKANNQPAYKVLQALSKANCFDIAQLSDKSLFLFPKPTSAKCEAVKNGTMITVN